MNSSSESFRNEAELMMAPLDEEWAQEWYKISDLFDKIDQIKEVLGEFEVPAAYKLSQQQVILNLERYAFSLSKIIARKYVE